MKIAINYELLSKINEAKCGFNINKIGKKMTVLMGIMSLVSVAFSETPEQLASNILYSFTMLSLQTAGFEIIDSRVNKVRAENQLRQLVSELRDINVSTDYESLFEAENYKTKYKLSFSDGIIPKLVQNKYIMVPTYNEGEVSLLQEHVVGTRKYDLSVGEPEKQKQYRLSYNQT